ncbi:YugN-like family protein [Bacillus massiliigorillae]|uniref:YugN-like family protein n=1 Tax=Bacillus massiliigorillae TaxID=1243664 RepID=UPI000399A775|nr:YugN-like family protein [Bacillus massiliigorillae]
MQKITSKIEGTIVSLYELEQILKPLGYSIAGNWDYNSGYFDYKMADEPGYVYLRVPFEAVQGQLDEQGAVVKIGTPFVLAHQYQSGLDDHSYTSSVTSAFNQFSEPADSDANIQNQYHILGKALVEELEFYVP